MIWGGAFNTENFRAGFEAVPFRYREGALALGFGPLGTFLNVTLPVGGRIALPSSINTYVSVLKNSAVLGPAIGFAELTNEAYRLESSSFKALEIYTVLALVYLAIVWAISLLIRALEARLRLPEEPAWSPPARPRRGCLMPEWFRQALDFMLTEGLPTTLQIAAVSVVGSAVVGVLLGTLLTIDFWPARVLIRLYIEIWRGLPILVTIFLIYFVLPTFEIRFDAWQAAAIGLTLWGSAQIAEAARGAIDSIPREQHEAASALGFGWVGRHVFVILPQALRRLLPPLVSLLVNVIQNSTLAALIGTIELLALRPASGRAADLSRARRHRRDKGVPDLRDRDGDLLRHLVPAHATGRVPREAARGVGATARAGQARPLHPERVRGRTPFGIRPRFVLRRLGEVADAAELGRLTLQRRLEPPQRGRLELAHALAGERELAADVLERPALAVEAETELEHAALTIGQARERVADGLVTQCVRGLLLGVDARAVGEQVAQLAVALAADLLVERHRRLDGVERLLGVMTLQAGRSDELVQIRRAAVLDLEPLAGTIQLLLALLHVHGHADGGRLVRDGTLAGLADPPGGIRRELEALAVVELLDGTVQPDHAVLDQIQERHAVTAVALRDRDDQAQVRVDHPLLGGQVATLDALRERDFLGGGEQVVTADLGEEAAERVGRDAGRVDRQVEHQLLLVVLAGDFHAVLGEDHADVLERLLVEAVLERERLELAGLDPPALLRVGHQLVERSNVVCRFQRCLLGLGGSGTASETSMLAGSQATRTAQTSAGAEPPFQTVQTEMIGGLFPFEQGHCPNRNDFLTSCAYRAVADPLPRGSATRKP